MAKNLRTHIPPSDKFVALDINQDMMNRFIRESESSAGAVTETAQNAREVAEKAVRYLSILFMYTIFLTYRRAP